MTFRDPSKPMWVHALRMLDQADRLHKHFFQLGKGKFAGPMWEPPIDVFETDEYILIYVALPGVSPVDVHILLQDETLLISSERALPGAGTYIRRLEIPYGRFERRIKLPTNQLTMTENTLENGCLRMLLRKNNNR